MAKKAKKAGSKKIRVDFGGVEKDVRRRARRVPEGDYLAKIVKGEKVKNKDGKGSHLAWRVQIVEDAQGKKKQAGTTLFYRTSLKPDALFNLRNLIYAASDGKKNVAGKTIDLDLSKYYGEKIGITVEDDEHEGKVRSQIVDVFPPSQLEADEDEETDEDDEEEEEDEDEGDEEEEEDDDDEEDDDEEDDLDDVDDDDL